jgi:hypothetical protein
LIKTLIELILLKQLLFLLLISSLTFSVSNFLLDGSLNSTIKLSHELKTHRDSLYSWNISTEPPFKYRVLHKFLVYGVYKITTGDQDNNRTFFLVYRSAAFLFHSLAIMLFYFFLIQINLKEMAFVGTILFSLLPPILLAYNLPVHTREDTLGYILLLVGLISIIRNNIPGIFIASILGVFCRETLLILPFVNLFFNKTQSLFLRLFISSICFGIFLLIRFYNGIEPYNFWEGLIWNKNNLLQVIGFGYITFGLLWIPFFFRILEKQTKQPFNALIYDSAPSVFFLVIVTTFVGGIFNEIRILYLLFPWVITIGLSEYTEHKAKIATQLKSKRYQFYATALALITCAITTYMVKKVDQYFVSQYEIPFLTWIIVASIQGYLGLLLMPYFFGKIKEILKY